MKSFLTWFEEDVWGLWMQGGSLMLMLLGIALILYYATLETYLFLKTKTPFKKTSKSSLIRWLSNPEEADAQTAQPGHPPVLLRRSRERVNPSVQFCQLVR